MLITEWEIYRVQIRYGYGLDPKRQIDPFLKLNWEILKQLLLLFLKFIVIL
jgi:hypothetical protein